MKRIRTEELHRPIGLQEKGIARRMHHPLLVIYYRHIKNIPPDFLEPGLAAAVFSPADRNPVLIIENSQVNGPPQFRQVVNCTLDRIGFRILLGNIAAEKAG